MKNNQPKMTESQIKVLQGLCRACNNRLTIKIDTSTVAWYADTNTLAAHKILESLVKYRYVRSHSISNASISGGAYKSAWSLTVIGRKMAGQ
jgi:hypothetical protein